MILFPKQSLALDILEGIDRNPVKVLLYGGAASTGKSRLGCYWILKSALKFAGTRWAIGRINRTVLYRTTVKTFLEVAREQGLVSDKHFTLNKHDNAIYFPNGSEILLLNLETRPSDPDYDDFGSLELTGMFIDEIPTVAERLVAILRSRIRFMLKDYCPCGTPTSAMKITAVNDKDIAVEWYCPKCKEKTTGLLPKLMASCNPTKTWIKRLVYDKWVAGTLPETFAFVPGLPTDNPYTSQAYLDALEELPDSDKQRLLYGSWEYADDENQMIKQPEIDRLLLGADMPETDETRYITADIALEGNDLLVICVWHGWHLMRIVTIPKSDGARVLYELKFLSSMYNVERKHVAYDADGVGGFLKGFLEGAVPFKNGASPIITKAEQKKIDKLKEQGVPHKKNYPNLKTQCAYILASKINSGIMTMDARAGNEEALDILSGDLSFIHRDKVDNDDMQFILPKDKVKASYGRSPDIGDAVTFRPVFDLIEDVGDSPMKGLAAAMRKR